VQRARAARRRWARFSAECESGRVRDVLTFCAGSPERLSGKQTPVSGALDVTFDEPLGASEAGEGRTVGLVVWVVCPRRPPR
jgi:hypothetical protein